MNFSIRPTMRRLLSPRHELSCSSTLWRRLLRRLRERGGGRRESGAFLLGSVADDGRRHIADFILYDDLDPHALDTGIVHLDGRYFGALWDICRARKLAVVADVHTHPAGSWQSDSDRAHPIISRAGHIALIVPNFAATPVRRRDVGVYRYLGGHQWHTIPARERNDFFHVGI